MSELVVDGNNVIGARPDGWWRDRGGAARRLLARLQELASTGDDDVTLVLDGRPLRGIPEGVHDGVRVLYARRGGADAADDRIVDHVGAHPDPGAVTVVTSDRGLRARLGELGAGVVGARALLDRLDASG